MKNAVFLAQSEDFYHLTGNARCSHMVLMGVYNEEQVLHSWFLQDQVDNLKSEALL